MTSPSEYESVELPPVRPLRTWTEAEAQAAAEAAYVDAPAIVRAGELLSEARRQARHAKTERRLAGIEARRPELAEVIRAELGWLAQTISGFAARPLSERIGLWYRLSTLDSQPGNGGGLPSRRGNKPLWPSHRAAAFVLLDWRAAQGEVITATLRHSRKPGDAARDDGHAPSAAVAWLATELAALDDRLGRPRRGDPAAYERMAFGLVQNWRKAVASGAHP